MRTSTLTTSAAAAAATLALAIGSFGFAGSASADPVISDPAVTVTATPSSSATSTASTTPTATPTATATTTKAKPKPKKKKAKKKKTTKKATGPKAKVSNYGRLTAKAKRVANRVRDSWRAIKSIGGWRAGSRYSGDHPAGRAIDVMIPNWRRNAHLGWAIAKHFVKYRKKYGIHYVIFRQKMWTTATPRWRHMSNRGGATANHYDHVHISVKR